MISFKDTVATDLRVECPWLISIEHFWPRPGLVAVRSGTVQGALTDLVAIWLRKIVKIVKLNL